jgi:hypothetical protein
MKKITQRNRQVKPKPKRIIKYEGPKYDYVRRWLRERINPTSKSKDIIHFFSLYKMYERSLAMRQQNKNPVEQIAPQYVGRIMREVFPDSETRRVAGVKIDGFHYIGLALKKEYREDYSIGRRDAIKSMRSGINGNHTNKKWIKKKNALRLSTSSFPWSNAVQRKIEKEQHDFENLPQDIFSFTEQPLRTPSKYNLRPRIFKKRDEFFEEPESDSQGEESPKIMDDSDDDDKDLDLLSVIENKKESEGSSSEKILRERLPETIMMNGFDYEVDGDPKEYLTYFYPPSLDPILSKLNLCSQKFLDLPPSELLPNRISIGDLFGDMSLQMLLS